MLTKDEYDYLTGRVIKCAIEVHRELGPGLIESIYSACLYEAMIKEGLSVQKELIVPVVFKGKQLNKNFIIDQVVENAIVLELKAVETIIPVHEAQLITYLKISGMKLGLLINFNVVLLKEGIRRRVHGNLGV